VLKGLNEEESVGRSGTRGVGANCSIPIVLNRIAQILWDAGMLRFYTAGDRTAGVAAFISGLPAQMPIDVKFINHELREATCYGAAAAELKRIRGNFCGRAPRKTSAPIALRSENQIGRIGKKPCQWNGEVDAGERKLVARGRACHLADRRNLITTMRATF